MSDQRGDLYKTIAALDETMSGYATPSSDQRRTDRREKSKPKTKCNRITVKDEPSELRRKRARQRHKEHQSANAASPKKDEDDIETLLLSDNEDHRGKREHVEYVRKPRSEVLLKPQDEEDIETLLLSDNDDHGGKREHVEYVRKPRSQVLLKPQARRRGEYKRSHVIDLRKEGRRGKPNKATGDYEKQHDNTSNTAAQVTDETHDHLALNSGRDVAAPLKKSSKHSPFFNVHGYAKVHPIDDDSPPIVRNKEQMGKITNMFCVESTEEAEARRAALGAAKSQYTETMVQKFEAVLDDDDDDDKFRPGVWNCALEFKTPTVKTPTTVGVLNSNALFHTLGRSARGIEESGGRTSKPIIVRQSEVTVDVTEAWEVDTEDDKDDIPVGCMSGLRNLFRRIFKRN